MRLFIESEAEADVEAARDWYAAQSVSAALAFLDEFEAKVLQIFESPHSYAVVEAEFRAAMLHRFPYRVFFSIEDEVVVVVACFHVRRAPIVLAQRLADRKS